VESTGRRCGEGAFLTMTVDPTSFLAFEKYADGVSVERILDSTGGRLFAVFERPENLALPSFGRGHLRSRPALFCSRSGTQTS
jgi:hypothetical protein